MDRREAVKFHQRVEDLADYLTAEGVLRDQSWRSALHEVPRHEFVPDRAYAVAMFPRGTSRAIDRHRDETDWWNAAYTNCSIVTQRDDGATDPTDPTGTPSCSLSCPHVAVDYLELLDLAEHHRVLEVGTGTGWTAAMLAWRLGGGKVTTVEVDQALAASARLNLVGLHAEPEVITGDGADGHPEGAPYDRVHVTCGVRDIPTGWLKQTRPGGAIVAPYMPIAGAYGHQLRLDVIDDETAIGRLHGGGGFMMLRSQRMVIEAEAIEAGDRSTTRMDPRLISGAAGGAQLTIAARVPGLAVDAGWDQRADGWAYVVRLSSLDSRSHAACTAMKGADDHEVLQSGPRRLWDEAGAAYLEWLRRGRPGRDRFGLTVGPAGQHIWLDTPDDPL